MLQISDLNLGMDVDTVLHVTEAHMTLILLKFTIHLLTLLTAQQVSMWTL